MKQKLTKTLFAAAAAGLLFAGCSSAPKDDAAADDTASTTIKVGATTAPHAQILEQIKDDMKEAGYDLEIVEFSDYPNIDPSTSDGSLDANYFQHQPYLTSYNDDQGFAEGDDGYLVSAGAIHYEPLGLYSDKVTNEGDEFDPAIVEEGAEIAVPNDPSNEARALVLLQDLGLITLKDGADIDNATINDIEKNDKNLKITELAADQIASKLADVDFAIVNGNYALTSEITDKLLTTEAADSDAAQTYQNVIAVKESRKDDEAIKKLVELLKSDKVKTYIEETYEGTVLPAE